MNNGSFDVAKVIDGAVGSEDNFCMGYGNPGASGTGYITTVKLSAATVNIDQDLAMQKIPLDLGTAGIVSYDRCESSDAYIGGINMLTASSFTGLNGAVWGYDLAKADNLHGQKLWDERWKDGTLTPVYSIEPILDAAVRLFGVHQQRRFNPLPGSMVVCANKNFTNDPSTAPTAWAWSFIALSFVANRTRSSNLFIEDCNYFPGDWSIERVIEQLVQTMHVVTKCVVLCGEDQDVKYSEIFIGGRFIRVNPGQVGCALACAPYVTLARKAIPTGMQPHDLMKLGIGQWEQALGLPPLRPDLRRSTSVWERQEKGATSI